ncbi:MAG TPA: TerC/Alx family metal homeostasis membrane protein [Phycisphaerales bacterium]|nr:TerC/Alx family metal homeostasis membrane protein [Phycisphaerales bacterium]
MIWLWIGFLMLVAVLLALDLFIVGRRHRAMTARSALRWTMFFVAVGALFNVAIYFVYAHNVLGAGDEFVHHLKAHGSADHPTSPARIGSTAAMQFLAGWLTEYSLSVDNLFVIAIIFSTFKVPGPDQHRVLFWGVLGAMLARAAMILAGAAAVERFEWVLYILGAFLLFTAWRIAVAGDEEKRDYNGMLLVRAARRTIPMSDAYDGHHFFTRLPSGRLAATPLLLVLLIVEATDVLFAVDSIPAVIGITRDPFLVFTSNIFAVLGLRSLYFALRSMLGRFHALKHALAAVLAFVGAKMLLEGTDHLRPLVSGVFGRVPRWLDWLPRESIDIPTPISLGVIALILAAGVVYSLALPAKPRRPG